MIVRMEFDRPPQICMMKCKTIALCNKHYANSTVIKNGPEVKDVPSENLRM